MKLTPVVLPTDAALLLESELPMLDAIEGAPTPEERERAVLMLRAWVVQTSAALRQHDPRSAPKPSPAAPAKAPCGCAEKRSVGAKRGEALARRVLRRIGL